MKVIVAGSRGFNNYKLLNETLNKLNSLFSVSFILSGTARGADKLGEKWADEAGIPIIRFKPDWSLGKGAGMVRNIEMSKSGDCLVAFWDGKSPGTKHMIGIAKAAGLKVKIVKYNEM